MIMYQIVTLRISIFSRHERETCINNLKLNLNVSSTKRSNKSSRDQLLVWRTDKSNPQDDRKRNGLKDVGARGSLDNVSRTFWEERDLDEESTLRRTRSFAVARENLFYSLDYSETHRRRAQLIPRAKLIEKSFVKNFRYESFRVDQKFLNEPEEIPPDYSPLPSDNSFDNFQIEENIYDIPPVYSSGNNSPVKKEPSTNLDATNSDNSRYRKSPEDLSGLSLPNYYPDSELTDNVSVTDNQSTFSQEKSRFLSLDNLPYGIGEQPESIPYDENIVLAKKTEGLYAKPRTIRGPTPYRNFDYEKLPQFSSDKSELQSSLEFETDTNCDEIKLNNENIKKDESERKIDHKLKSQVEVSPAPIEKLINLKIEKPIKPLAVKSNQHSDNQTKTLIKVCSAAAAIVVPELEKSDDFKTIVRVDDRKTDILEEAKSHSHNYLKEFLETQKGSKKPLQSFIAKKFSNLTRRNSKSNLVSNQFYSLPDITVSKNLHKCEKIDKKLRKCDKAAERIIENRFIVNIGKHFDITAKSNIPVDFQVKIAKIPKKSKNSDREADFKEAVKNVNSTLQSNGFSIDLNNNANMDPEILEKVDNIRNYWTKIVGNENNEKRDEEKRSDSPNDKIIEIQTKVNNVKKKFEPITEDAEPKEKSPNKIQLAKQLFEPKVATEKAERISPTIKETCNYFEKHQPKRQSTCFESLCPSSVELITKNEQNTNCDNNNKPKKYLAKSNSISIPEFDHVRYKVIKPELFNKKILANCDTEEQFDGLMQYLQDYSFQELLIDNNIVIIEPIRTKVPYQTKSTKASNGISAVPKLNEEGEFDDVKQGIRKHFFYHPIRVNKEVNDEELPNPEVVRQARQFFEKGLVKSKNASEKEHYYRASSVDPDRDKCSTSSSRSTLSEEEQQDNMYDSLDNNDWCTEYVSEDILEKIREYGTTVTYYGGRVVDQHNGQPILTKVIMEEIKNNEKRCMDCSGCRRRSIDRTLNEMNNEYQGIKFKLVKSNSCSSRLELVGAANKRETKKKLSNKNNNSMKELNSDFPDKNAINETIKLSDKLATQPRIIGEERKIPDNNKYIQWSAMKNDKEETKINNYDYHEKVEPISKRPCDMEFEPYEVA